MVTSGQLHQRASSLFVRKPLLIGLSILASALILSAIGLAAYPFFIETSSTVFVPKSAPEFEDQETVLVAEEATRFNPFRSPSDLSNVNIPTQTFAEDDLTIIFVVPQNSNLFTIDRINAINSVVASLLSLDNSDGQVGWEDVCLRDRITNACATPRSLLPYFYAEAIPTCSSFNPTGENSQLSQPPEDTLRALIDPALSNVFCSTTSTNCTANCREAQPASIDIFVRSGFGFPDDNASKQAELDSDVTRVVLDFGLPLSGFQDMDDRYEDQIAIIEKFLDRAETRLDEADGIEGMDVRFVNDYLLEKYFLSLFTRDLAFIVVAITVVVLYMIFHLQSVFLALTGMLHILLSFPVAYLFAQASMDFGGMGLLNLMSLFIILGIGADDVFILVDAFKQSANVIKRKGGEQPVYDKAEERSLGNEAYMQRRMTYAYGHAAKAMLITSLTTGAAFVMNLTSTVPAIQIFGGFTSFMVFFNYMFVITVYPCMIMLYEYYAKYWPSCISWCIKQHEPVVQEDITSPDDKSSDPEAIDISKYRPIEQLFYSKYAPFVNKYRVAIVAGFVVFFAISLGFAMQLEASDEPAQFLPSDDPIQETLDILADRFEREETQPQLTLSYGLRRIDMSGTNPYDPSSTGKTRFDSSFDVSSEAAQEQFVVLCERYRLERFVYNEELLCPMEAFRDYVESTGRAFPVPQSDFIPLLANFTRDYEEVNGPAPDYSGATSSTEQDATTRESRRLGTLDLYQTIRFDLESDTPTLKYMLIIINTTLPAVASAATIEPMFNHWNGVMRSANAEPVNANATLNAGFQTASIYLDMVLENTLLDAAVIGIVASLSLAFFVIAILTADFLLSTLSILAIGGVVTSLICLIVWMGWALSIIESVCLTILVGLSVDYVIHLAQAYRESRFTTRFGRMRDAATVMGISVLSASITTMLSALLLLFTYIIFFQKFGTFILLTILMSTLWAFGFFMALLTIVGNRTHHNDWKWLWYRVQCKDPADPSERLHDTTLVGNDEGSASTVASHVV